ncbi:MAG: hypothetical protein A3K60_07270 [Euryarchaeota archaeon RBG_19FT_COMBO_56_21]|nr:MAG: hypothetical protein A3K60_07270 [Euryarchaeota archaeon RBG_19FT_COMBO_56_21]
MLALSLLATVFVAFPTSAAVDFTGSVKSTDNAKAPKDVYVQGQAVYVVCEVLVDGYHAAQDIEVRLETLTGGLVSNFHVTADTPDPGWYNSTEVGAFTLATGGAPIPVDQDRAAFYVILEDDASGFEISKTTITILKTGLRLEPPAGMMGVYTPGQALTAKLITQYTGDILYVHTTNATGVDVAGMNWSTVIAPTGYWEKAFTLSADMPDGDYTMKVRDSTSHALRHTITYTVQKYYFDVSTDRSYYLPGEVVKMEVVVIDIATYAQVPGVTVRYWAEWDNFSANGSAVFHTWQNGTLTLSMGIWEFTIPTNVVLYNDLYFMFWANESAVRSVQEFVDVNIGALRGSVDAADAEYMPGDTVVVETSASLYWDDLPGANVDVVVLYNGTAVADYGKTGLVTAVDGTVTYTFPLSADANKGVYIVKATISKLAFSIIVTDSFEVNWDGWIEANFDKDYYYTGDHVVATFEPIWNGAVIELTSINYAYGTDIIMATGSQAELTVEFDLPEAYNGDVWVEVTGLYNGYTIGGGDGADVRIADLALNAEKDEFRPGDTLVWNWQIVTNLETASLEWEVVDDDGTKVAGDTPAFETSGSFEYDVPDENPSDWYGATIWMTTVDGGFEEASFGVDLVGENELRVWAGGSKYTSGEFQPGDTVKLHYSIAAIYHDPFPAYELYIWTDFDPIGVSVFVDSNEGSVDFDLPDDAPAGETQISVQAYDAATGAYLSGDSTIVVVNAKLSGWDRSVAGMAASDFTIMVLIIIMILLLIIVPLLKSKGVMGKSEKVEAPPPTPPQ